METKGEKGMNKWGVRLIALIFIVIAIFDVYGLVTGTREARGGLGFDLGATRNGEPVIDIMAWVEVVVLSYAGIQLLRFRPSGRSWAEYVFGLEIIFKGIGFCWFINQLTTNSLKFSKPLWLNESGRSIAAILIFAGAIIILYVVPIIFLTRDDVKQLFEKTDIPKETTSTPDTTLS